MNVYDFDNTIYRGDATKDFYRFCLKKHPCIIRKLPTQIFGFISDKMGKMDRTEFKERFFSFLQVIKIDKTLLDEFWDRKEKNIEKWYLQQRNDDDVVITASPEFLIFPVCERLGIKHLIATRIDLETGKCDGANCHGEEKVKRFLETFKDTTVDKFYSDSLSDAPMAKISTNSFLVKKGEIIEWIPYSDTTVSP